ncbi:esterase/lipase family protein [Streptomyces sp. NPDC093514]|uniref:esterase/lipase family protein n=1 Tax=Streptomyces sp. NPDC093514 TaxID=3366039 RepID=UPI00380824F8
MGSAQNGNGVGLVFVHGLFSSKETWDKFLVLVASDEELRFVTTLRFDYASPKVRLRPDLRIPDYNDLAEQLKAFLEVEAKGYERLVLVAHSQGGLIVQRYLARMLAVGRGRELARIKGVVLFAVPNDGSGIALLMRKVWWQRHPQERELRPLADQVKDAHRMVLDQIVNATAVGTSTCPIPFWVYGATQDNIVVRASAQGSFPRPDMLPGSHTSVIHPDSAEDPSYRALREHLRAIGRVAAAQPGGSPPDDTGSRVEKRLANGADSGQADPPPSAQEALIRWNHPRLGTVDFRDRQTFVEIFKEVGGFNDQS